MKGYCARFFHTYTHMVSIRIKSESNTLMYAFIYYFIKVLAPPNLNINILI